MTPPTFSNPYQFDMLMLEPVHAMMHKGIKIDQEEKKRLQDEALSGWKKDQDTLDGVIGLVDKHGEPLSFNVSSTKWVPHYLYSDLGLPPRKRKGKSIADDAALRSLMAECSEKVSSLKQEGAKRRWMEGFIACRLILNIRGRRKQISSFLGLSITKGVLDGTAPFEDDDGRIRGTVSVGGTKTARFSHSKTLWGTGINLATVPRKLRSMFVPDDGYEFIEFDLERGESWVYAHLSEDPELLRIHLQGLDFHSETAAAISSVFGSPLDLSWIIENRKDRAYKIRFLGKKINFAVAYRMTPFMGAITVNAEADETGITITTSKFAEGMEIWKAKYFMIESNWWNEIEAQLKSTRTLRTPYGREHMFHDRINKETLNSATAYVPQSTSVDYLNRGWLKVHHDYQEKGAWDMSVLAQTHDSILVQLKEGNRDEAIPAINSLMKSELTIKDRTFTIPVEGSAGPNWKDLSAA